MFLLLSMNPCYPGFTIHNIYFHYLCGWRGYFLIAFDVLINHATLLPPVINESWAQGETVYQVGGAHFIHHFMKPFFCSTAFHARNKIFGRSDFLISLAASRFSNSIYKCSPRNIVVFWVESVSFDVKNIFCG